MSLKPKVALSQDFLLQLAKLPSGIQSKVMKWAIQFQSDPTSPGINYENINGARDSNLKSVRLDRDWRGIYEHWQPTPILVEGTDSSMNRVMSHNIADYLDRYGFGIEIDPQINQEINNAISTPGSFAAYGRIGLIIVIPKVNKVVYVYNG